MLNEGDLLLPIRTKSVSPGKPKTLEQRLEKLEGRIKRLTKDNNLGPKNFYSMSTLASAFWVFAAICAFFAASVAAYYLAQRDGNPAPITAQDVGQSLFNFATEQGLNTTNGVTFAALNSKQALQQHQIEVLYTFLNLNVSQFDGTESDNATLSSFDASVLASINGTLLDLQSRVLVLETEEAILIGLPGQLANTNLRLNNFSLALQSLNQSIVLSDRTRQSNSLALGAYYRAVSDLTGTTTFLRTYVSTAEACVVNFQSNCTLPSQVLATETAFTTAFSALQSELPSLLALFPTNSSEYQGIVASANVLLVSYDNLVDEFSILASINSATSSLYRMQTTLNTTLKAYVDSQVADLHTNISTIDFPNKLVNNIDSFYNVYVAPIYPYVDTNILGNISTLASLSKNNTDTILDKIRTVNASVVNIQQSLAQTNTTLNNLISSSNTNTQSYVSNFMPLYSGLSGLQDMAIQTGAVMKTIELQLYTNQSLITSVVHAQLAAQLVVWSTSGFPAYDALQTQANALLGVTGISQVELAAFNVSLRASRSYFNTLLDDFQIATDLLESTNDLFAAIVTLNNNLNALSATAVANYSTTTNLISGLQIADLYLQNNQSALWSTIQNETLARIAAIAQELGWRVSNDTSTQNQFNLGIAQELAWRVSNDTFLQSQINLINPNLANDTNQLVVFSNTLIGLINTTQTNYSALISLISCLQIGSLQLQDQIVTVNQSLNAQSASDATQFSGLLTLANSIQTSVASVNQSLVAFQSFLLAQNINASNLFYPAYMSLATAQANFAYYESLIATMEASILSGNVQSSTFFAATRAGWQSSGATIFSNFQSMIVQPLSLVATSAPNQLYLQAVNASISNAYQLFLVSLQTFDAIAASEVDINQILSSLTTTNSRIDNLTTVAVTNNTVVIGLISSLQIASLQQQGALDTETAARISNASFLQGEIQTLQGVTDDDSSYATVAFVNSAIQLEGQYRSGNDSLVTANAAAALSTESAARSTGDSALQTALNQETQYRINNDTFIQSEINLINPNLSNDTSLLVSLSSKLDSLATTAQTNYTSTIGLISCLQVSSITLQSEINTLNQSLLAEAAIRAVNDSFLQDEIHVLQGVTDNDSVYATTTDVSNAVSGLASTSYVNMSIAALGTIYTTISYVNSAISGIVDNDPFVTVTDLSLALNTNLDLSKLYTNNSTAKLSKRIDTLNDTVEYDFVYFTNKTDSLQTQITNLISQNQLVLLGLENEEIGEVSPLDILAGRVSIYLGNITSLTAAALGFSADENTEVTALGGLYTTLGGLFVQTGTLQSQYTTLSLAPHANQLSDFAFIQEQVSDLVANITSLLGINNAAIGDEVNQVTTLTGYLSTLSTTQTQLLFLQTQISQYQAGQLALNNSAYLSLVSQTDSIGSGLDSLATSIATFQSPAEEAGEVDPVVLSNAIDLYTNSYTALNEQYQIYGLELDVIHVLNLTGTYIPEEQTEIQIFQLINTTLYSTLNETEYLYGQIYTLSLSYPNASILLGNVTDLLGEIIKTINITKINITAEHGDVSTLNGYQSSANTDQTTLGADQAMIVGSMSLGQTNLGPSALGTIASDIIVVQAALAPIVSGIDAFSSLPEEDIINDQSGIVVLEITTIIYLIKANIIQYQLAHFFG